MRDAILDSAGLVAALARGDQEFAAAATVLGDPAEMVHVLAGWLADAVRSLDEDHATGVLAGFRALAREPGGWADYEMPEDG